MKASKKTLALVEKLGVKKAFEHHKEVKQWLQGYLKAINERGDEVDADNDGDELASTIKLVCDVYEYAVGANWLEWQTYLGPRGRGPWWTLAFQAPNRWEGASMFIRDPSDFGFYSLIMSAHGKNVAFEMHSSKDERITKKKEKWLAESIMNGLLYEYEESEFNFAWLATPYSLKVDMNAHFGGWNHFSLVQA